jgi:hypothetical protein
MHDNCVRLVESRILFNKKGENIMKLGNLMATKAIIVVVFGIGSVLIPTNMLSFYGVTLNPGGAVVTQLLGASFILLGTLLWLARNAPSSDVALRAIVLAVTVGDAIGFIVALLAQLSGMLNALGWVTVALYLLLALGFGYFQFFKPATS